MMLCGPLILIGWCASMMSEQSSRFATPAVSSLLSTSYQQMKSQSEPSSLNRNLVFIYSAGTDIVALTMLITADYKPTTSWQSTLSSQQRKMQLAGSRAKGRSAQREKDTSVHRTTANSMQRLA
jgi:hypothetical protein